MLVPEAETTEEQEWVAVLARGTAGIVRLALAWSDIVALPATLQMTRSLSPASGTEKQAVVLSGTQTVPPLFAANSVSETKTPAERQSEAAASCRLRRRTDHLRLAWMACSD